MAAKKQAPGPSLDDDGGAPPHKEQPGERRAVWIITRLEAIQDDPDLSIDARDMLMALPQLGQRYVQLLLREGPVGNADAARLLKTTPVDLEKTVVALENAVKELLANQD